MTDSLLLDTPVFLWFAYKPNALGKNTLRVAAETPNLYLSTASLVELAFKHGSGKFAYGTDALLEIANNLDAKLLAVKPLHLSRYATISLPPQRPLRPPDHCPERGRELPAPHS